MVNTLSDDKDVRITCLSYFRNVKADQRDAFVFMTWVNVLLKSECEVDYKISISERTARNWPRKFNFDYDQYRTGSSYVDGHERPNIVDFRNSSA